LGSPPAKKRILSVGDFQLAFRLNLLQLKDEVLFLTSTVLSPPNLEYLGFFLSLHQKIAPAKSLPSLPGLIQFSFLTDQQPLEMNTV
jgi:hypothetical protein